MKPVLLILGSAVLLPAPDFPVLAAYAATPLAPMSGYCAEGGAACYARAMTAISRRLKSATMKAGGQNAEREDRVGRYALRRGLGTWEVTFEGRRDSFSDEQGAEYAVWLLLHPPPQPIHAVALALEARHAPGYTPGAADVIHLREHLLIPSGRGGGHGGVRAVTAFGGCFTYEPPAGVVWWRIED